MKLACRKLTLKKLAGYYENYTAKKITNQENGIVLDMKKNIQKHISQLQLCNENLEKMLHGMIVTGDV